MLPWDSLADSPALTELGVCASGLLEQQALPEREEEREKKRERERERERTRKCAEFWEPSMGSAMSVRSDAAAV